MSTLNVVIIIIFFFFLVKAISSLILTSHQDFSYPSWMHFSSSLNTLPATHYSRSAKDFEIILYPTPVRLIGWNSSTLVGSVTLRINEINDALHSLGEFDVFRDLKFLNHFDYFIYKNLPICFEKFICVHMRTRRLV